MSWNLFFFRVCFPYNPFFRPWGGEDSTVFHDLSWMSPRHCKTLIKPRTVLPETGSSTTGFWGKNWKTDILWQSTAVKLKKPWIRLNSDCGLKRWRNSSKRQRRKNSDHLESLPLDMCLKHKMFCFLRKWMCTNQVGTSWSKAWCSWNVGVNLWKFEVVSPHSTVVLSAWWHRIDIDW